MYLENIKSPSDVKKLSIEQLNILASEMRSALIQKVSEHGGHIGPNLGMVEATIALHYVFESPKDKIVYDVSHQSYPHKMLTGRQIAFTDSEHYDDVTGFTNPEESEHDFFVVGHTSTSVSLATGMAKGRDLCKRNENVIAVIGDGSLSGGQALEGLNYAGEYKENLIIVVNDNDQSIAENHGGLYQSLKNLRETNGTSENNIFKSFSLDYDYLEEGHDIEKLIKFFEKAKDIDHPIVMHIHTIKGKGLAYAETNREEWHAGGPFKIEDGTPKYQGEEDTTVFDSLTELLDHNENAVVLNASLPMGLGFTKKVREDYVNRGQFIDVGIAEETAIGMISGIVKNGATAVFGTQAAFLQRTYDQVSHDLCLNDNPATILALSTGVFGMNSNTHLALCDIQFFAHIPNLIYLDPSCKEEYLQMFHYATTQRKHPIGIRLSKNLKVTGVKDTTDYSKYNVANTIQAGESAAIIAVGSLVDIALETAKKFEEETGTKITVIHPRFLSGIDEQLLDNLKQNHKLVITLDDGELEGGYGQRIASYYGDHSMKVLNLGISKFFHTEFDAMELLKEHGISVDNIVKILKQNR